MNTTVRKILLVARRNKREIRAVLITGVVLVGVPCPLVLGNWLEVRGRFGGSFIPIVLIYALLSATFLLVFLINRFAESEYEIAERAFEARCKRLIVDAFGRKAYQKLRSDDDTLVPLHAIDLCAQMFQSQEANTDTDLCFHILAKLASYYARNAQPNEAVRTLQSALAMRPYDAIANSRLAGRFEMTGRGNEAITHYEAAQKDGTISARLKEHFAEQVKRVQIEGPRVSGPLDGSGIWWMWGS